VGLIVAALLVIGSRRERARGYLCTRRKRRHDETMDNLPAFPFKCGSSNAPF
jgi:hypothetical protein